MKNVIVGQYRYLSRKITIGPTLQIYLEQISGRRICLHGRRASNGHSKRKGSTKLLVEYFRTNKYYPVLLSPNAKEKAGAVDNVWKVDVNLILERDL